ncbi:MAG: response regulator [Thiobacillus sp.]|nr:response regulator [Thiobacillus sp.]
MPYRLFLADLLHRHFPAMRLATACDAGETWRRLDADWPDLVFMDVHLQDGNGLVLTRAIKDAHPATVVIVLTSHDLPEYQSAALTNGASFFLTKGGATSREILDLVASLVGENS